MTFNYQHIAPTDLRDYAKSMGWQLLPEAVADNLYVLSHPSYKQRQLVFPLNTDSPDYTDAIEITINKLAEIIKQPISFIISSISELNDDTLRFRVVNTRNEQEFIPLSYAVAALNGAKDMYLAAASSVLKPQFHHPRLNRSEALQLLDASKFRQTETGSFVLKVSSPIKAVEIQSNLFDEDIPFARQTTLTINKGLAKLVNSIQADTLTQLVDDIKNSTVTEISSNFCKSIVGFKEEHNDFDLFVDFSWAGSLPVPSNIPVKKVIKIQKDYFSRIDEVRRELRNTEQQKKREDTFMASVEHLAGEIGQDDLRAGEVILNLYQEDEIIKAKTNLSSSQYIEADKAHMTTGSYIKIKGKLHPGNQPRNLTDVSLFELIMP